jgi:hypothetical protein
MCVTPLRWIENAKDTFAAVAVLFERPTEESQFCLETFWVADRCRSLCQGEHHRMLIYQMVVRLGIHVEVNVGRLYVYSVSQGFILYVCMYVCMYVCIQCVPRSLLVFCI